VSFEIGDVNENRLKIGPKRGAFCGTNLVCILLAPVGSAVWLDNSAEGRHCCIPASTLKSSVLTCACSNIKREKKRDGVGFPW
jgi:hypothetical protein